MQTIVERTRKLMRQRLSGANHFFLLSHCQVRLFVCYLHGRKSIIKGLNHQISAHPSYHLLHHIWPQDCIATRWCLHCRARMSLLPNQQLHCLQAPLIHRLIPLSPYLKIHQNILRKHQLYCHHLHHHTPRQFISQLEPLHRRHQQNLCKCQL